MITHKYIDEYVQMWERNEIELNKDRIQLIKYLQNVVLVMDGIYFNNKEIEDFISFTERYFFKLEPFQKFIACFIFLYHEDGETVFDEFFITMARGAGKNGFISALSAYFISPLTNIYEYNVAIVANSEDQAKKSFMEVHNMLKRNPELTDIENGGYFKNGLARILCHDTLSTLDYLTSNASTKDSFAHGVVIFDEVHEYESDDIVEVLTSGLGKVQPPRIFYISTNGFIREGVYDRMLREAKEVLENEKFESTLFPFICTLDSKTEVNDERMWQKANPMFHQPLSKYAKGLMSTVRKQWNKILAGRGNKAKWLTKRMNISDVELETSVATKEEIMATNREMPMLALQPCIGGLDYASLKDFAAVGCLFELDGTYYWKSHSFVRKEFLDNEALAISREIPEWERRGLLTVLDEPTISIHHIVDWFAMMREKYGLTKIVGDSYRIDLVRPALEEAGFEVEFVRRATAIQATIAPQIEVLFAQKRIVYGDNPLMRWYTNNVYVKRDKYGNMMYDKKEEKKRKTDGFMAFTHAYWRSTELAESQSASFMFDDFDL